MRLSTVVCSVELLAAFGSAARAQAPLRVNGGLTRVVTGNAARVVASPPNAANRKAATVLRLPFVLKAETPAPVPAPGPGTNPTPPNPTPNPTPTPPPAVFEPQLEIDHFGLLWDPAKNGFSGRVRVGVVDTLHRTQPPTPLPAPITFQLSADGANITPDNAIVVVKTNEYQDVVITTSLTVDSIRMHVVPLGLDVPVDVAIAVTRIPLDITFTDTMPGLGLGRAEVLVALPMLISGDSVDVYLNAERGSVSPQDVWVKPGRPGRALFWSSGLQSGTLVAKAAGTGLGEARADVAYMWPIGFTVACLIGVVIGGVGTMAFKKLSWTAANVFAAFGGGLAAGVLLAVVGSLLGVKIAGFDPAGGGGLALVFALALLGALLGSRVVQTLVPGAAPE